jgi:hypothetical protein
MLPLPPRRDRDSANGLANERSRQDKGVEAWEKATACFTTAAGEEAQRLRAALSDELYFRALALRMNRNLIGAKRLYDE